jgi:hypothetical protein
VATSVIDLPLLSNMMHAWLTKSNYCTLWQADDPGKEPADQFEEFCEVTENTACWGGQVELQALAQAIERHIRVHCVGLSTVELGQEYRGEYICS